MPRKRKPAAAAPPATSSSNDAPPAVRMVEVGPDHWIGLPTFDINEWFDMLDIPPEERSGILARGGGYNGFRVSADLEREAFEWLHDHGGPAASVRARFSGQTMAGVARRFARKAPGERGLLEHLDRLDAKDRATQQTAHKTVMLSDREQEVDELIHAKGPITAKEIANSTGIGVKVLSNHILPKLKRKRGLLNKRSRGYFYPP